VTEFKRIMLASDWDPAKLRFPVLAQPKIDGVRAWNPAGTLLGRSMKQHANRHVRQLFSRPLYQGFDGEMIVGTNTERDSDICRRTTSALNSHEGQPQITWWLFDYLVPEVIDLPYQDRYMAMVDHVDQMHDEFLGGNLRVVPSYWVTNMKMLEQFDDQFLDEGYEGTIIRDPNSMFKQGRSTVREGGLLRIKRFIDAEAVVLEVIEGQTNGNEQQLDERGLAFRSTHAANMQPNGLLGTMRCRISATVSADVAGTGWSFTAGQEITVSAGAMTHAERKHYFENPAELVGQTIKFKFFPKGVKDKPRFPTFLSIRANSDMGGE